MVRTVGWQPGCECYGVVKIKKFLGGARQKKLVESYRHLRAVKCLVLDPFAGSGTTLGTAVRRGRKAVGIELNPKYAKLIPSRVADIVARKVL